MKKTLYIILAIFSLSIGAVMPNNTALAVGDHPSTCKMIWPQGTMTLKIDSGGQAWVTPSSIYINSYNRINSYASSDGRIGFAKSWREYRYTTTGPWITIPTGQKSCIVDNI